MAALSNLKPQPSNKKRRGPMMPMFKFLPALGLGSIALLLNSAALGQVNLPVAVEQSTLAKDAFSTGTLRQGQGALGADLWKGADAETLEFLLSKAPTLPSTPSLGDAMRRTLLTEGNGPQAAPASLGGRKLLALSRAGFTDEARNLASLSNAPRNDPHVGQALATADLLDGDVAAACARNAALANGRDAIFWVKLRVLCYAVSGERDAADLTFALLQERGSLSETDNVFLSGLLTGAAPKTPPSPETALHLAALRQMKLPLTPSLLGQARAGVVKAVMSDESIDMPARLDAATRAASMGIISGRDLIGLYQSVETDIADVARAMDIADERPYDPLSDVLIYQSVRQMTAPEFLRDKASRISAALSKADSFPRAYALSLLYDDGIGTFDGALISPSEAGQFAMARMTVGDSKGAARWLYAMLGTGALSAMDEANAMKLIELNNLLSILDPTSGAAVAKSAGITVEPPYALNISGGGDVDAEAMARIVEAALSAAVDGVPGQAALAALAASNTAPSGDLLAGVVIGQSLRAAGLEDLQRRMAFEAALKAHYAKREALLPARAKPAQTKETGLTPRLKPNRT